MLVDDLPKREVSQASGVQDLVHKGLLLDTSSLTNQRFLDEPRVTLGDSIELSSIVTSPGPLEPEELDFPLETSDRRVCSQETSELASDCTLRHTRAMVRITRHVAVNVRLLAKCGELDTKLSAVLGKHKFFQSQIQIREWTAGLNGRHFDGCIPAVQKTLQLVECEFPRIQNPSSMKRKRHLRAPPEFCQI